MNTFKNGGTDTLPIDYGVDLIFAKKIFIYNKNETTLHVRWAVPYNKDQPVLNS